MAVSNRDNQNPRQSAYTDNLKNWIPNFKVKQVDTTKSDLLGKVQFRFLDQLGLIYEKVKVSVPSGTKKPIVLRSLQTVVADGL